MDKTPEINEIGLEATQEALGDLQEAAKEFSTALSTHLGKGFPRRLRSVDGKQKLRVNAEVGDISIDTLAKETPECDIIAQVQNAGESTTRDECLTVSPHAPKGFLFTGLRVKRHQFWPGKNLNKKEKFFGETRGDTNDKPDEAALMPDGTMAITSLKGSKVASVGHDGVELQRSEVTKGVMLQIRRYISTFIQSLSHGQDSMPAERIVVPHADTVKILQGMTDSLRKATQMINARDNRQWIQTDSEFARD